MENNIKETLEKKLTGLKGQLVSIEAQDPYKRDSYADENTQDDDAAEREDHDRVVALKQDLEQKIVKVEKALERVQEGSYGVCIKCGNHIDKARLEVIPEAGRCIDCSNRAK